jgi:hypothetical protein
MKHLKGWSFRDLARELALRHICLRITERLLASEYEAQSELHEARRG